MVNDSLSMASSSEDTVGAVALLLDWENIGSSNLAINDLIENSQEYGRVVIARAYADFRQSGERDPESLYRAGIEPVYVFANRSGKNSTDMRIAADCIELCQLHPSIGTYILATGDGDFIHLLNVLKRCGKKVVIVAVESQGSGRLNGSADGVIYIDRSAQPRFTDSDSGQLNSELKKVYELVGDMLQDQEQPILLSALKPAIVQRMPGFDQRRYEFPNPKFKNMMLDAEAKGYLKVETKDLDDWVMPVGDSQVSISMSTRGDSPPSDFLEQAVLLCADMEKSRDYITFVYLASNLKQRAWGGVHSHNQVKRWLNEFLDAEGKEVFTKESVEYFNDYNREMAQRVEIRINRNNERVKAIL